MSLFNDFNLDRDRFLRILNDVVESNRQMVRVPRPAEMVVPRPAARPVSIVPRRFPVAHSR